MTRASSALYKVGEPLSEPSPKPASPLQPQRWSIIAAGLLLLALALVVLYTSRSAFSSPLAMVVVAAIGFAALLLQIRLRKYPNRPVRSPLWVNIVAVLFALAAVFADALHLSASVLLLFALGAIVCFAVSGIVILRGARKQEPGT
jgi:tellurite resistance protein TehA-like permease